MTNFDEKIFDYKRMREKLYQFEPFLGWSRHAAEHHSCSYGTFLSLGSPTFFFLFPIGIKSLIHVIMVPPQPFPLGGWAFASPFSWRILLVFWEYSTLASVIVVCAFEPPRWSPAPLQFSKLLLTSLHEPCKLLQVSFLLLGIVSVIILDANGVLIRFFNPIFMTRMDSSPLLFLDLVLASIPIIVDMKFEQRFTRSTATFSFSCDGLF